ncbi:hypothetical protein FRC02_009856 [Tulasnella sp. 418]|nr:hypothetical protein FRC02_009856 [Tulasnella sp. 418]
MNFAQSAVSLRSFHALDDVGDIHVWGTLNGEVFPRSPRNDPWYAQAGVTAWTPVRLHLPTRFIAVSCSRKHSAALDARHRVWLFTSWGRPNLLTFTGNLSDPFRHPKLSQTKVIQVECGWGFTSFLTDDGRVFVIWPTSGAFAYQEQVKNDSLDGEGDGYPARAVDGVVHCIPVEISAEPLMLPDLPRDLPHLRLTVDEQGYDATAYTAPKLIKIAAGEYFIIGLTDQGHVLCIDLMGGDEGDGIDNLRGMFTSGERDWVFMPEYCDIRNIVQDPVYAPGENGEEPEVAAPASLHITHISAHFDYFVAYSPGVSSTVLMSFVKRQQGHLIERIERTIHANLQNQDVILIVLGDYHFGALHGDGKLSTWGSYSKGALGLGDPVKLPVGAPGGFPTKEARDYARDRSYYQSLEPAKVEHPSPVRFDWDHQGRKRYCFAVAAAGWHMGALVIDLDNYDDEDQADTSQKSVKEEPQAAKEERPQPIALLKPLTKFYKAGASGGKGWKKLLCGCVGDPEKSE